MRLLTFVMYYCIARAAYEVVKVVVVEIIESILS